MNAYVYVSTVNGGSKAFWTEKEALDFTVDAYQYYLSETFLDIPESDKRILFQCCRDDLQSGVTFKTVSGFCARIQKEPLFRVLEGK